VPENQSGQPGQGRSGGRPGHRPGSGRSGDSQQSGRSGGGRSFSGRPTGAGSGQGGSRRGAGGSGAQRGGDRRVAGSGRRSEADRGPGTFDNSERRGGARLAPKKPRLPEPRIAEGVTGKELDRSVHQQLRTLSKENAEGVAQHLVMVAALLEAEDLAGAEAHAETAVRRAGRVPAAREALGLVAYRKGEWGRALSEFRTARRLSGSSHMLPLMVDCERGLGRPERALDLATSPRGARPGRRGPGGAGHCRVGHPP
jgi:hypothetical protein